MDSVEGVELLPQPSRCFLSPICDVTQRALKCRSAETYHDNVLTRVGAVKFTHSLKKMSEQRKSNFELVGLSSSVGCEKKNRL